MFFFFFLSSKVPCTCLASQADTLMSRLFYHLWCTEQSPTELQYLCHTCIDCAISRNTGTHTPNLLPWQRLFLMHETYARTLSDMHTHTHGGGRWGSGLNVHAAIWSASHSRNHVSVMQRHSQTRACVNSQLDALTLSNYPYVSAWQESLMLHAAYIIHFHMSYTKIMPSSNTRLLHPCTWATCGDLCSSHLGIDGCRLCDTLKSVSNCGSCII